MNGSLFHHRGISAVFALGAMLAMSPGLLASADRNDGGGNSNSGGNGRGLGGTPSKIADPLNNDGSLLDRDGTRLPRHSPAPPPPQGPGGGGGPGHGNDGGHGGDGHDGGDHDHDGHDGPGNGHGGHGGGGHDFPHFPHWPPLPRRDGVVIHFGNGGGVYYTDGPFRGYAFGWPWWYDSDSGRWEDEYVVSNGSYSNYGPTVAQTPAPTPPIPNQLSDEEKADAALAGGNADAAVRQYEVQLRVSPSDELLQRKLAVALIDQKNIVEAVAVMASAYEARPELALTPLEGDFLGDSARQRRRVNAAVANAHEADSASAWLAVMVLMQGEGRNDVAAKMLPRAIEHGLSPQLAEQWRKALGIKERVAPRINE